MTKEELLKPRIKVMADWPRNNIMKVGEIWFFIEGPTGFQDGYYSDNIKGFPTGKVIVPGDIDPHPHLFKKLEWWEERDKKDMPKYLKDRYRPGMVNNLFVYKVKHHFTRDMTSIDCAVKKDAKYWVDENDFSHIYTHYEAATEAEFNSQKQTTNG